MGETLQADINHGGEYYLIEAPGEYGIIDAQKADSALLIISDIYISNYIENFKKTLGRSAYKYPIWTFISSPNATIEENAKNLAWELKKSHEQFGSFRLDVVSFGIGGLIAHRYVADSTLYQKDISSAIIAVGTPFKGTNFADIDSAKQGSSPFRFFFIDGYGDKSEELNPNSALIKWIAENSIFLGFSENEDETKNFASIRGKTQFLGRMPEESEGDGLISVNSTFLTPVEPKPFFADHFELFERNDVLNSICEFINLYRSYTWPSLFRAVWKGQESISKVGETWIKEAKLHYPGIDFEVLLEWAENLLRSTPQDAILITNGDNDTYPLWYLQSLKGIRNDVIVVNWSLLNTAQYIRYLIKNGLPLEINDAEIDSLRPYMDKKNDRPVFVADQIISYLVAQNKGPVVFSTTLYDPEKLGYPLCLTGIVYELNKNGAEWVNRYVNIEKTERLLYESFSYDKFFSASYDSLCTDIQAILSNHASSAFALAMVLKKQQKYDEALKAIAFGKKLVPPQMISYFLHLEASIYLKKNSIDKADSLFNELLGMPGTEARHYKETARIYHDELNKKDRAILILAEALKRYPQDKEITELIKKYQED
ncbi:MAG TPA: hypothetical protein VF399_02395 [bacterium]